MIFIIFRNILSYNYDSIAFESSLSSSSSELLLHGELSSTSEIRWLWLNVAVSLWEWATLHVLWVRVIGSLVVLHLILEDVGIVLLEVFDHSLAVFKLHERWLEWYDGVEDLISQIFISNHVNGSLEDVVAELIVYELLYNELDSDLEILGLRSVEAKLLDDCVVIIWEGSVEDLVDAVLSRVITVLVLLLQVHLNYVAGEFQLAQSDEVFGDLFYYLFVFSFIFQLKHVLDQEIAEGILDQMVNVLNNVVSKL